MQDRLFGEPLQRRKSARAASIAFAVLTTLASLHPGMARTAQARTLESMPPSTLVDTPCSENTKIKDEKPQMEISNTQLTIRGYRIDGFSNNALFKFSIEPGVLPRYSTGISISRWNLDLAALVNPPQGEQNSATISISGQLVGFDGGENDKNLKGNNKGSIKLESVAIPGAKRPNMCTHGTLEVINGAPQLNVNGVNVVTTATSF
jgi:hypothetical protein